MSREASELTQAIRQLLDETNGEITHSEARAKLTKLGFDLAEEMPEKSEEFSAWEQYEVDYDDPNSIANTAAACNFDEKTTKAVVREAKLRTAYKAEANSFNVIKSIWKKSLEKSQEKPVEETSAVSLVKRKRGRPRKGTPVPVAVEPKKMGRPKKKVEAQSQPVIGSVDYISRTKEELQKAIEALESEIVKLQSQLKQLVHVKETLAA
jgi:hypothetical protein